jgi:D-alanyl-lipoteichoic acid acyltransferase DltB (MBOAT superfamily)
VTFNSLQYAVFLPLVLAVYWRLSHRGQNALLLLASYAFYALWNWRFVGLMMLSTATDYTVGLALDRTDDDRRRKVVFATSLVVNLGVLGFFKYYDFFVDEGIRVLGVFGLRLDPPLLHVLLPIGISFYTFHGISYTFDVFRRDIRPARSSRSACSSRSSRSSSRGRSAGRSSSFRSSSSRDADPTASASPVRCT